MKLTNEEFEYCSQFEQLFREALDVKSGTFPGLSVLDSFNDIYQRLTGLRIAGTGYGCSACNYELVCTIGRAYRADKEARRKIAEAEAAANEKAVKSTAQKALKHISTNGRK